MLFFVLFLFALYPERDDEINEEKTETESEHIFEPMGRPVIFAESRPGSESSRR